MPVSPVRSRRLRRAAALAGVALLAAACSSTGSTSASGGAGAADAGPTSSAASGTGTSLGTTPGASSGATPTVEVVTDDAALYAAPDPVPAGEHGTLLRYQELTPTLAEGTTSYRIMYLSRSLQDEPIVVTGTVLVPTMPAPDGGRATFTIAHGTTGIADECAPSKNPSRSEIGLMAEPVKRNWLVVQTDYEGLGTPGRHPYLVGESEGRSVIDATLAAGALPDADPSGKVMIAGYSQGGHGALWANEVAGSWAPQLDVVGTFAGAPATEMDVITKALSRTAVNGFLYMLYAGYQAAYPQADPSLVLTPEGLTRLDAVDQGCTSDVFKATAGDPAVLMKPEGNDVPPWSDLATANNPGQVRTPDPVLIIHSDEDSTVPVGLSKILHARMCRVGQVVERRVLTGGGSHVQAAAPAYTQAFTWLADRLDGVPTDGDCAAGEPAV